MAAMGCAGQRAAPTLNPDDQVAIGYDRVDREDVHVRLSGSPSERRVLRVNAQAMEPVDDGLRQVLLTVHEGSADVAARPHDEVGAEVGEDAPHPRRHLEEGDEEAPVLPRPLPVERVQIEQLEGEARRGQHVPLHPAVRADEEGLHRGVEPLQRARDGEARVQVAAGAAAREEDVHPAQPAAGAKASGSVAPSL